MIRVYEFGLLPPTVNAALVDDQMYKGHRYRNALVEIEQKRRIRTREVMASHPDTEALSLAVAQADGELEALRQKIAKRPIKNKRRVPVSPEDREACSVAVAKLRELRAQLRTAKDGIRADPTIGLRMEEANEAAKQAVRDARADCGVYWGTYLLAEQAMDAARKSVTDPRFVRWHGDGRVSVQLQGGLGLEELATDTQLQIEKRHDPRTGRRANQRCLLRMRVQSNGRAPVWAEWPMTMHRPIPEGSRIKVATVSKRRQDCRTWAWRVHITVDIPDGVRMTKAPTAADGVIALNLGWCRTTAGLRVGYLVAGDGTEHEVIVPEYKVIQRIEKSESIASIRDKNLNEMRAKLAGWLAAVRGETDSQATTGAPAPAPETGGQLLSASETSSTTDGAPAIPPETGAVNQAPETSCMNATGAQPLSPETVSRAETNGQNGQLPIPVWLDKSVAFIAQWRSAERFRNLALRWRDSRVQGDDEGYSLLEAWRYRDEHLERYQSGMRRGALLHRREGYRILAARLATTYRTLLIDTTDLSELQRTPSHATVGVQRLAAPHELRMALVNAFRRGGVVTEIDHTNVTRRCHVCGVVAVDAIGAVGTRMHTCGACSVAWDQDANACRNLLQLHRDQPAPEEAAPKESRWAKLKKAKAVAAADETKAARGL